MKKSELAAILSQALQTPVGQRVEFLERACGGDATLRERLERMLKAYEESGAYSAADQELRQSDVDEHSAGPQLEGPGSRIGPYKLLQLIGEGGFGFVYMAEQHEPVRRKVALKIVKPGMDTREVIARFEAERQALALMDHPNIARVLDAGATVSGRPYFVMELVRGVSLTEYCDKNQLSTRDRLGLFSTICQAVQHAHHKGVIHRDLKPSNILVTLHDGKPVPKVIDFGVAKALNQQLTEKTLFTAYGQMVGTPQYMSPEQAEMSGLDVDTRSDIYSLGVLLYELLTGATPLDSHTLRSAGFVEMQRMIREQEPVKPSTRISTLGAEATVIARHRSADPRRLRQELQGELDWIVMKALEKDRSRRYASAGSLADDLQRFLRDEAVLACPPSAEYRFRKFARRNTALLATIGAIALILLAGAAMSTVMAVRAVRAGSLAAERLASEIAARRSAEQAQADEEAQRQIVEEERDRAESARQRATVELEHARAAERQAQANFAQAQATVDRYLTTVSENQLLTIPGMQPLRQAMLDAAQAFYEQFVTQRPKDPQLRAGLAAAYARLGRVQLDLKQREQGQRYNAKARQLYEALFQEGHDSPEVQRGLAELYFLQGRADQAALLCQRRLRKDPQDREAQQLLGGIYNTLAIEASKQNVREALNLHRDAYRLRTELVMVAPDNPEYLGDLGSTVNNIGVLLARKGRSREALLQYQRGVEFAERAFAAARHSVMYGRFLTIGRTNEAGFLNRMGLTDEAIAARRRVAEVWQILARDNPALPGLRAEVAKAYRGLANLQRRSGKDADAARTLLQSRQLVENLPQETAADLYNLAVVYATLGAEGTPRGDANVTKPLGKDLQSALRWLARAIALGYKNRQAIDKEPTFAALSERPDFQMLVTLLELRQRIAEAAQNKAKLAVFRALRDELQPFIGEPLAVLITAEPLRTISDSFMQAGELEPAEGNLHLALETLQKAATSSESFDALLALESALTWQMQGQALFRRQRYREAMNAWQSAQALLEKVRSETPDDERAVEALAALDYEQAEAYGTLGAFETAREAYARGFAAVPTKNKMAAVRHAAVLAQSGDPAAVRKLADSMQTSVDDGPAEAVYAVIAECLDPAVTRPGRSLIARAAKALQASQQTNQSSYGFAMALATLRGARKDMAIEAFNNANAHRFGIPFYQSLAYQQLGDARRARLLLDWGESIYRRVMASEVLLDANASLPSWRYGRHTQFAWSWFDVRVAQLSRAEATAALDGQARPDPWKHLLAARGLALLGRDAEARSEFERAETAAGDDAEVWSVCGLVYARSGHRAAAEKALQRAIDLDPQRAESWIARARYYAECGATKKAEVDFMQAASLTPGELHKFLEGGWWVQGPVAPDIDVTAAINQASERLSPASASAPESDSGAAPPETVWQRRQPDAWGRVRFGPNMRKPRQAALAMTYIYSPDERTMTLWLGGHDRLRVWFNGELVHKIVDPVTWIGGLDCTPVLVHPGRNVIFIEAQHENGPESIFVRLGDAPLERAFQLSRLGLWRESLPFWQECRHRYRDDTWMLAETNLSLALVEDSAVHASLVDELLLRAESDMLEKGALCAATHAANLMASTFSENSERIERLAIVGCEPQPISQPWQRAPLGMTYYRRGRYAEAIQWLQPHAKQYWLQVGAAMSYHRLERPDHAQQRLTVGDAGFRDQISKSKAGPAYRYLHGGPGWFDACEYIVYRRQAARLMEGQSENFEKIVADYAEEGRRELARRTPDLAAFDEAVAYHNNLPRAWRARARRLMELERWDEALRDLDQAVALDDDDPRTWCAYAQYWLARGNEDEAAQALLRAATRITADALEPTDLELLGIPKGLDQVIVSASDPTIRTRLLLARARYAAEVERHADAERDLQAAIELDSTDAAVWIARGRFYAERGQSEQADADFAKAASLTAHELNRFLEGGWWIVGPYPAELREFCPPELDPDPSQPMRVMERDALVSAEPVAWRSLAPDAIGRVSLAGLPQAPAGASVYALANVYSPEERTATLWLGPSLSMRCWVNGQLQAALSAPLVLQVDPSNMFVPITLRQGRNQLLLKVATDGSEPYFMARLGDHPYDRGGQMLRYGLLSEGAAAIEAGHRRFPLGLHPLNQAAMALLATGDAIGYRRISDGLQKRLPQITSPNGRLGYAALAAYSPVPSDVGQRLVEMIEGVNLPEKSWRWREVALVQYRAGNWSAAIDAGARKKLSPHCWPILAMAYQQNGQLDEARGYLEKARQHFRVRIVQQFSDGGQGYLPEFLPLYREACSLIEGDAAETDRQIADLMSERRRLWEQRDPTTRDFDDAIHNAGEQPQLLIARGQRLAALARWDDAEVDFDAAMRLAPDDWRVSLARASFLADRGETAKAADQLQRLLGVTGDSRYWTEGRVVEREIASHERALDELQSRAPQAAIYWRLRGERQIRHEQWEAAETSLASGKPYWSHYSRLALMHCLEEDYAAHRHACEEMYRLIQEQLPNDAYTPVHRCAIETHHVADAEQAQELLRLAWEAQRQFPDDRQARLNLGLAYYRNGRFEAARVWLEESLAVSAWWQEHAVAWPALAMCHWRLGRHEEARQWLAKSDWWVTFSQRAASAPDSVGPYGIDSLNWLRARVLHQEALQVVR